MLLSSPDSGKLGDEDLERSQKREWTHFFNLAKLNWKMFQFECRVVMRVVLSELYNKLSGVFILNISLFSLVRVSDVNTSQSGEQFISNFPHFPANLLTTFPYFDN